jgi:hypothetical protein
MARRYAMRVFLLRMFAVKNSRNRQRASSPAEAMIAGTPLSPTELSGHVPLVLPFVPTGFRLPHWYNITAVMLYQIACTGTMCVLGQGSE